MMFESTAPGVPGENQSGAEREHVCLFLFVSAGSCSGEVAGMLQKALVGLP